VTTEARVADLVPHAGGMCLLERIVHWDESGARLATRTHRDPANPLARGGRLHAIHLCEYGAQAMAVHGGLVAQRSGTRPRPGMLVLLRDVDLHCEVVHDRPGELIVEATRVQASPAAWQYDFRVTHEGGILAQGRATVSLMPGP